MSIVNVEALKGLGNVLWWTGNVATANSPKSISANGDCKQILPFSGAGIAMLDGSGDYLLCGVAADWNFMHQVGTTGKWSVAFWYQWNNRTAYSYIACTGISSTQHGFTIRFTDTRTVNLLIGRGVSGQAVINATTTGTLPNDSLWHRLVVTYDQSLASANANVYCDGVLLAGALTKTAYTPSTSNATNTLHIGCATDGTSYFNGSLSEVAFYNGICIDGTTVSKTQTPVTDQIQLLLRFNTNGTSFVDYSLSPKTITHTGNVTQLCSPCGSGIASFDGTGDALTFPAFDLSTGNFTYECTFKINATGSPLALINRYYYTSTNKNVEWSIHYTGTYIAVQINTGSTTYYTIIGTTVISTSTLYHVALVRNGSVFTLYVNGVSEGTPITNASALTYYSGRSGNVGRLYEDGYIWHLNGYISEVRLSNTARYTTTFTPSTQPFKPDPYTKLLLHMDGVTNGFYDSSDPPGDNGFPILPDGVTVTPSGTFTTQKMKDGRNIWAFDGSTNYITISDHATWSMFTSDFTIVAWIKFDSIVANRTIIGQYTDANNQWFVRWTTGNLLQLFGVISGTSTFSFTCPMTPVAGTWYHVVVQRSGSSCIIYINGVAQTVTQSAAFSATATNIAAVLSIGNIYSEYQAGNTKDLQIFTKALTMDQVSALYQETYIY